MATLIIPMIHEEIPVVPATYEYHVVSFDRSEQDILREEQLNELGKQGWFLVRIQHDRTSERIQYCFIRQNTEARK